MGCAGAMYKVTTCLENQKCWGILRMSGKIRENKKYQGIAGEIIVTEDY